MGVAKDHTVTGTQLAPTDDHAVDDRPVRRLQIVNDPLVIAEHQARVMAGDARLIDHDIAVAVAPDDEF
jgi:hypothetical protein